MGFLFRLGFSMLLAWFITPSVRMFIGMAGVKVPQEGTYELLFAGTTLLIYFLSRMMTPSVTSTTITSSREIGSPQVFTSSSLSRADAEQIKSLLNGGNMIEAIKFIRAAGNLGLKEAKDMAENLKASGFQNISIQSPGFSVGSSSQTIEISSPEDRIRKLNDLKDKGLISEAEYDEKRKEILDQI